MAAESWIEKQNLAARSLIEQGSQALRANNLDLAQGALTEAAIVLDMAEREEADVLRLRAQAFNELGVVHQRRGDGRGAYQFHHQAATLCDQIIEKGDRAFRGNAAATHLNLANIQMAAGEPEAAKVSIERAAELGDELLEENREAIRQMASAIQLTRATVLAMNDDAEGAGSAMELGLELGAELLEAGQSQILVQMSQACQQLSVVFFEKGDSERALLWGRRAEEHAERAFEEIGQDVVAIYVVSQINLISYNEKLGNFADAEDSLWKAIELVGDDARLLKRGQDFYEFCRKQADKRLAAGNLPRAEVDEGLADIRERIEQIGGLPDDPEAALAQQPAARRDASAEQE